MLKISGEAESPNERACLRFKIYDGIMMSRYHQRRGVFKIGGVFILFFFGLGARAVSGLSVP